MQQDELEALISNTAALMEQFERRCVSIEQRLQASALSLHNLTEQVPETVKQAAHDSLQGMPDQMMGKALEGLDKPVHDYQLHLHAASHEIGTSASALALQIKKMEQVHQMLIWKVVGVVAISLVLLLVGGAWLSMHYYNVIRNDQVSAEMVKAYNAADVVMCGSQLCANIDPKGQHYGSKGEYVPIRSR